MMKKLALGLVMTMGMATAQTDGQACTTPTRDIIDEALAGAPLNTDQRKWALNHKHLLCAAGVVLALHLLGTEHGLFSSPFVSVPAGWQKILAQNQKIWNFAQTHASMATLVAIGGFLLHDFFLRGNKSYLKLLFSQPAIQSVFADLHNTSTPVAHPARDSDAGVSCARAVLCAC